ncbi:ABC transporter substrate-binding protein [Gracilibacillus phocaeensis]|uniref:ABC transporter substrate-binding protein n=1 Tax=Gracilibacillus phocaeensis TaxID=2042304 RepID=UPI00102FA0F8|nr:ABC transporter substrate-binding protein [Gracilibacillus phocaeensis]
MKKIVWLSFMIGFMLIVSACSDDTSTGAENSEAGSGEKTTVSVGYMPNFASVNTVVAGMRTGAFEEQDIEVELVEFADGPTIIAALESGNLDIGYIGPGAHVLPIQGNSVIFAFSQLGNADEVIGNTSAGVETIEDLEGKTVAVAAGTSSETILDLTLAEVGLTTDDVELVNMDASAIVTAMTSGSVDAAATWSPNTNTIKNELGDKAIMLSNNSRYADISPSISSWVVSPAYAEENRDILLRYTKGLFNAADYRKDHLDEVAGWVAEEIAVSEDSVLEQTDDGEWLGKNEILEIIEEGTMQDYYQTQKENFIEAGSLTEEETLSVEDYVLFDLMTEAAQ